MTPFSQYLTQQSGIGAGMRQPFTGQGNPFGQRMGQLGQIAHLYRMLMAPRTTRQVVNPQQQGVTLQQLAQARNQWLQQNRPASSRGPMF